MKNKIFIFLAILFLALSIGNVFAQISRGTVEEGLTIDSKILNKKVRFTIYLPYDYKTSSRYYPVVYLLHGYTDNDMGWIQFGEANRLADKAIAEGEIPPMILAMPDGGVSWYINNFDNSVRYEDFFINEFIPYIEKNYRVRTEKRYRAVAGLSMGGYGSLIFALKHPDSFSSCAAFSAAIYTEKQIIDFSSERWDEVESILYGQGLKGKKRITKHLLDNNPFHIINNSEIEKLKSVRIYINCGDDDWLSKANAIFHTQLKDLEIPHEYRVRNGSHSWRYWRSGLVDGLKFIGESFH